MNFSTLEVRIIVSVCGSSIPVTPGTISVLRSLPGTLRIQQHNAHKRQTSMPPAGFEPAIAASWQRQT